MSSLGARFDTWLTTQPEYPDVPLPGDHDWPRCEADGGCGAWLRLIPDDVTPGWATEQCDGQWIDDMWCPSCGEDRPHEPHPYVVAAWDTERRVCRSCGRNNYRVVA